MYVLRAPKRAAPSASAAAQAWFEMRRGRMIARKQPLSKLCTGLTAALGLPVVDETRLSGQYDWEVPYQPGQPDVVIRAVAETLGLEVAKAHRSIPVLVVEKEATLTRE